MIAAVIVLYNPNLERFKKCLNSVIKQIDIVYLIDNNSKNIDEVRKAIGAYVTKYQTVKIQLIENGTNLGIACALNQGVKCANSDGAHWLLTLDQDSIIPDNLVSEYNKIISDINDVGIVTCRINYNNVRLEDYVNKVSFVEYAITSASLICISICNELGGFDERMFIDGVDYEYCFRVINHGYRIAKANDVVMEHELGNLNVRKFLWKTISIENHNSMRVYYISRNYIYRYRKNKRCYSLLHCFKIELELLIKILLYENDKMKKTKSIFKGIIDGTTMPIYYDNYIGD